MDYLSLHTQGIDKINIEQYEDAITIFEQCMEMNPQDITNYIYLGIVNLLQGDEGSAEILWMSMFIDKQSAETEILSQILIKTLDKQASLFLDYESTESDTKAEIIYSKLIDTDASFPDSYLGLGIIAMRRENYIEAINNFNKFIQLDANFAKAYHLRGLCFKALNKLENAVTDFQQAINLAPNSLASYQYLGNCLLNQNKVDCALSLYQNLKQEYPNYAEVYIGLGTCFVQQGKIKASLTNFNKALEINIYLTSVYAQVSSLLEDCQQNNYHFTNEEFKIIDSIGCKSLQTEMLEICQLCYEIIIQYNPHDINSYCQLIDVAIKRNNLDEAIKIASQGIDLNPNAIILYTRLADWLERNNSLDKATQVIKKALTLMPNHISNNFLDAKIIYRLGDKKSAIYRLKSLANSEDNLENNRQILAAVCSELANIYHKEKDYQQAFYYFDKVKYFYKKEYQHKQAQKQELLNFINHIDRLCTPSWLSTWKDYKLYFSKCNNQDFLKEIREPKLVFLVGFSRSGTTLLGQILNRHPQINTLDEKAGISAVKGSIYAFLSQTKGSNFLSQVNIRIEALNHLTQINLKSLNQLREIYFKFMKEKLDSPTDNKWNNQLVLVDKNPFHLFEVAAIHRLFPDAKFICSIRHPYDVCLSSFMQNFALNTATSNFDTLENTAIFYSKVMNLWLKSIEVLPVNVSTVFYEDLITNYENVLREIFAFLGVEWSNNVLQFNQNKNNKDIINTPSYRQINQSIYREVKYRWHNYRSQIEPIKPILEPFVNRWGYEN